MQPNYVGLIIAHNRARARVITVTLKRAALVTHANLTGPVLKHRVDFRLRIDRRTRNPFLPAQY